MVTVNVENLKDISGGILNRVDVACAAKTKASKFRKENAIVGILKIGAYCTIHAVLHPRTPIELANPGRVSPVPWWGAVIVIVLGIGAWICGSIMEMGGLTEAARAMVYLPLGNMFGMAVGINSVKASDGKS